MVDIVPPCDEHKDKDCRWEVKGFGIIFGERENPRKRNKNKQEVKRKDE